MVDSLKALDPNRPIREADLIGLEMRTAAPHAGQAKRRERPFSPVGVFLNVIGLP